jgi:hypothetical protein
MDPTITAAIIGATAAVLAALIGLLSQRRKVTRRKSHLEKSKALRLGYILAAIQCYLDAQKMGIGTTTDLNTLIAVQTKRLDEIASSIGISAGSNNVNELIQDLPLRFDGKEIPIKSAFKIGHIIGRIYFYSISLMATGSLPPIETDIDRLGEAEVLLRQADLPSDFLSPVKKMWKDTLAAAGKGRTRAIDTQMEDVLDQLCASIEHDR